MTPASDTPANEDTPVSGGRLQGRIALITGASRGIGRAIAVQFAREGAHLILVSRTSGALEEVDDEIKAVGGEATLVPVDLTDYDAIDRMGAALYERFGRLDVVVGNAGMLGILGPINHTDPKVWERTMALNSTANWRLIRSLDPLLKASEAGRGIFLTSSVGAEARAYWGVYAVSKAALEMTVNIYAEECEKTSVCVNLVNPGATRTAMRAEAYPGEDPDTLKTPESIAEKFVELAMADCTLNGERITL